MIRLERDTHGRTYQIWQQQQENSCGVACVWMARGIARQASFAEEEWDLAIRMYQGAVAGALGSIGASPTGPVTFDSRAYPANQNSMANTVASFGLYGAQVATSLRNEGLRVEHTKLSGNPPQIVHSKIAYNKPAIVLVLWNGGGGHFLVVGRCTPHEVSFLDPWNGRVNQQRNDGKYTAQYGGQGQIVEIIYISA
jgi:hypothetical protein